MGRVYATGDVVRIHRNGEIEFAGRADNQVKIRGHRIELGEIESVLDEHPAVIQSVVVAQADEGDTRLVAYVVASPASELSSQVLREHVAATLPSIMVPSAVVRLDAFPLTPNGKIDRKALPAVDRAMASARLEPITAPPDDDTEKLVAGIWADELGVSVGRDDNFFDVGGHSLLAVKVFRRICEATDAPLALTDVFRFPTVRTIAAHIGALQGSPTRRTRRPLARRRDRCRPGCDAQESACPPRPWGDARRRPVTDDRSNDTGNPDTDVAIVGMAGRFPGAPNVDELWRRVAAGEDCLVDLSREVLRADRRVTSGSSTTPTTSRGPESSTTSRPSTRSSSGSASATRRSWTPSIATSWSAVGKRWRPLGTSPSASTARSACSPAAASTPTC